VEFFAGAQNFGQLGLAGDNISHPAGEEFVNLVHLLEL
ncbi:MAG: hypothetical protein UX52_C0020G0019, partial [Candidatus Amesbacteria bacterium GW2011_GWA1_46_35]